MPHRPALLRMGLVLSLICAAPLWIGAPCGQGVAYPLQVAPDGRYLQDQRGKPFLIHGDSPWSLIVQLTREEAERYLDDRRAKGMNTLMVNLIEHRFSDDPPRNAYGDEPFTTPGDYATPNEAYFTHADFVIREAAERGIQLLLTPSYLGFGGGSEGWYQEMVANGPAKMRAYGRYLGERYASAPNLIWLLGGDFNPPQRELVDELAEGILERDASHLLSAHCAPESSALDVYGDAAWLDVNDTYSYDEALYLHTLADDARSDRKAFFMLESRYEGEHDWSPERTRRQAYWPLLTGAMGQLMGNNPIWLFAPGWEDALDSQGARELAYLKRVLAPRRWWELRPDPALLSSGAGGFGSTAWAAAARTADGKLAIVYVPSTGAATRTLGVNLAALSGPVVARWSNPTSGALVPIPGSPFANQGTQLFTTPGDNGTGSNDWTLLLEVPL